jgi:hypothetical protein
MDCRPGSVGAFAESARSAVEGVRRDRLGLFASRHLDRPFLGSG